MGFVDGRVATFAGVLLLLRMLLRLLLGMLLRMLLGMLLRMPLRMREARLLSDLEAQNVEAGHVAARGAVLITNDVLATCAFYDLPHFSHPLPRPPTHPYSLYYRILAEKESSLPPLPSPYPPTLTPPEHY